jgi:hypothetical protein
MARILGPGTDKAASPVCYGLVQVLTGRYEGNSVAIASNESFARDG